MTGRREGSPYQMAGRSGTVVYTFSETCSVTKPEPVEPKLFETWSRNRSRNFFKMNRYRYLITAVSLEDARVKKKLMYASIGMVLLL